MDLIPLPAPEVPTKENHFHYLFSIYIFCTFTSLFEPAPALQVVQHITMSLKSLVISFPWPCHYSSPALPLWPFLSLSRCSSNPALLQRLKIKEIKHRYWVLACKLPWRKGETISLLYFINPISLSLLLAPFSASAWKIDVVCNDVLPTSCFSSFSASSYHSPASRFNLLLLL